MTIVMTMIHVIIESHVLTLPSYKAVVPQLLRVVIPESIASSTYGFAQETVFTGN